MGRAKYVLVLCAVAAVVAAVPIAQGTSDKTPTARIAALEAKVTKLQKQVSTLGAVAGCLTFKFAGVTQYPAEPTVVQQGEGYLYRRVSDQATVVTTALDYQTQGQTPDLIVAAVNPQCVQPAARARAASGAAARRPLVLYRLKASMTR
jgi:hypothetical protein